MPVVAISKATLSSLRGIKPSLLIETLDMNTII